MDMQFYINRDIDPDEIRQVLSRFLEIRIAEPLGLDTQVDAIMLCTHYEKGFPLGIVIMCSTEIEFKKSVIEVARHLARRFHTIIATDLPSDHPDATDPFCWCVVEPDSLLFEMSEDLAQTAEGNCLILDPHTKRLLG